MMILKRTLLTSIFANFQKEVLLASKSSKHSKTAIPEEILPVEQEDIGRKEEHKSP